MTLMLDLACPQSDAPPVLPTSAQQHRAARLLAELAARADECGEVRVTVQVLADALCVAERTVQRASLDLVSAGLLEVIRPPGSPQRGVPNLYRLAASCNACTAGGDQS